MRMTVLELDDKQVRALKTAIEYMMHTISENDDIEHGTAFSLGFIYAKLPVDIKADIAQD